MNTALFHKSIRSAVIFVMAALLAFLLTGCGGQDPSVPSGADLPLSGESLVEIGPKIVIGKETEPGAKTDSKGNTDERPASTVTSTSEAVAEIETPDCMDETVQRSTEETMSDSAGEQTQAPPATKPGLWAEVPTEGPEWETRAVSDVIYYLEDFGFTTYVSPFDADGDGVEDQADILQGAKDYVATRPVYDSGYFAGGWPPAGRGVCSDVVAYALRAAGYDLQKLVDDDVKAHPDIYNIAPGDNDPNIDYRRTRNLLPFFRRFAEELTLDPYDYAAWQPGDIVIFESPTRGMWPGHIAVVSDRRASDGLPYLIHHTDNDRYAYEQDFLTTPTRIIKGHFRVSGFTKAGN